jgi:hypothetical protein
MSSQWFLVVWSLTSLSNATTNLVLSSCFIASQYAKLSFGAMVAANENTGRDCNGLQFAGMTRSVSNPAMSQFTGFGSHLECRVWMHSKILGGLGGTLGVTPSEATESAPSKALYVAMGVAKVTVGLVGAAMLVFSTGS